MNTAAKEAMSANLLGETLEKIRPIENPALRARIEKRLDRLTAPRGSLGRLEEIVFQYGLATDQVEWLLPKKSLFVFCADHGVARSDTASDGSYQMVRDLAAGKAVASVLCRRYGIDPIIVDMGVDHVFEPAMAVIDRKLAPGTKNFLQQPAMSREQAVRSIEIGIRLAQAAHKLGYRLLATGEIAEGSSIVASAVITALTHSDPQQAEVSARAIALHHPSDDPLAVLSALGGFEIGGMAGFLLGAAAARIPVCIDGRPAAAAAVVAARLSPNLPGYLLPGYTSGSEARPILDLEMQSNAGAGAALVMNIVDSALHLYRELAPSSSGANSIG